LSDVQTQVEIRAEGVNPALWHALQHLVVAAKPLESSVSLSGSRWMLQLSHEEQVPDLVDHLHRAGVRLYELTPRQPALEDVFLHWVGQKEAEHAHHRQTLL
jgi:ABC-2 type transport system ATP-binding protein